MTHYRSVKLPNCLVEAITAFITTHNEYGYVSIADFVKNSVRKNLESYKRLALQIKKSENPQ